MEQEVTDLKESYNEIDEDSRAGIDADVFGKMEMEQGASIPKERRKTYLSLLKMGLNSAAQKKAKPQDSNTRDDPCPERQEVRDRVPNRGRGNRPAFAYS